MFNFDREEKINKERIRRLANWYRGKKEGPVQIDVELHKRCNLRCIFCARFENHEKLNKESKKYEMPLDRWLSVIEEAIELDALIFNIEGINEPPAAPEIFFPVINKVKDVGMYGIITTNGTLWKEDQLKNLVEMSWDRIHFSVHSVIPQVHDNLTGMKGCFKKVIKNIQLLNKWKKKLRSERPMLNINICINKLNFRELPEIVELAHSLDAAYIFTEPLMVYSETGRKLKLSERELKNLPNIVEMAKKIAEKYGIDNNFATQDKNLEKEIVEKTSEMEPLLLKEVEVLEERLISAPCFKPWERIAIRYNGLAGYCGYVENGENVMDKNLIDIWFGEFFQNARRMMLRKKLFPHCHKCVPSDFTQRKRFRKELMEAIGMENGGDK
ncbi:MAG: radical SAM protein [Candidatus Aenigmatarchaeota archaeon]